MGVVLGAVIVAAADQVEVASRAGRFDVPGVAVASGADRVGVIIGADRVDVPPIVVWGAV